LASLKVKAEQYYLDNRTYAGLDCTIADAQYFTYQCAAADALTYKITATGLGPQAGFTFTIDQDNNRATVAVPAGWTVNAACWVTKRGGVCT
jgi:type IV pilus assembly protein PilE